ncbi:MAG: glutamate racemase [Aureispira sp.]
MTTNPSTIAFFDSGMGGLTVLQEALQRLPNEQYVYFADSESAPYGTKSTSHILQLVENAVHFLTTRHTLKALVVACNTATSVAIKQLRTSYDFPIIGMEPALKPALQLAMDKEVLVCATQKTLAAPKLQTLATQLNAQNRVQRLSLQRLVTFAEQLEWDSARVHQYLQQQFKHINWATIQAVVLGCTHFPYYKPLLQQYIPVSIPILDGHAGTVRQLQTRIALAPSNQVSNLIYYRSGKQLPITALNPYLEYMSTVL